MTHFARRSLRSVSIVLAALALARCGGENTEPHAASGPGRLAVRPQFAAQPFLAPFNLAVDSARIVVARPSGGSTVVDTTAPFALDSTRLRLQIVIPLLTSPEAFDVTLELRGAGIVLFSGASRVSVTQGLSTPAPTIPLTYVGPGGGVTALRLAPLDTVLTLGDSFGFRLSATDAAGNPVPQFYVTWRSSDTAVAKVTAGGALRAPAVRGAVMLTAITPGGVADSTPVTFVPRPASIVPLRGDKQNGGVTSVLPQPLVARVLAADGKGVKGIPVQFQAVAGGSIVPATAVTDANGDVSATATLGTAAGAYSFTATVAGAGSVTFGATATIAIVPLVFLGDSAGGLSSGVFQSNPDGSGRGVLSPGPRTGEVHPHWSPLRDRVAFAVPGGASSPQIRIAAATGGIDVPLVTDTNYRRPRFSPNRTHLAFECGDGFSTAQDVCVIDDVSGPVAALLNLGNGAGKRFLTDLVATRVEGSGAFAWDPRSGDSLVFVRDTFASGRFGSGLYVANFDGANLHPLAGVPQNVLVSPSGPFNADTLVVQEMVWSPDGSFLILSAKPHTGNGPHLYRIARDGSNLQELTAPASPSFDVHPSLSPDGSQIVFFRAIQPSTFQGGDYFRIPSGGGAVTQVTAESAALSGLTATDVTPDWSPDGGSIVLTGTNGGNATVFVVKATTTATSYAADRVPMRVGTVKDVQPSWRP